MGDVEDMPVLAADNWHVDQEVVAPTDGGDMDMVDFNGLSYSRPSFIF